MFRRHWSGLPKDPVFPSTLEGLGYFINDEDEIRSVENPDCYFKYAINRNQRINSRQSFHFKLAMEDVILTRLADEGLQKLALPLGTAFDQPHIPIFVSPDIDKAERIVLIVPDTLSSLGVISYRVAHGPGGLNHGTAVSLVRTIRQCLPKSGIVLSNPGALHWWPEGKRSVSGFQAEAAPLQTLVSLGRRVNERVNRVGGHGSDEEHLERVFELVEEMAMKGVKLDVVGIGSGAELAEKFLDSEKVWGRWGGMMEGMVLFGTNRDVDWMHNGAFKAFLAKRCRAYTLSSLPLDTPLSPPAGNPPLGIPALGLPVYSSSEDVHSELITVAARTAGIQYLAKIACAEDFANAEVVPHEIPEAFSDKEETKNSWEDVREDERPAVRVVSESELEESRMWDRWEETGIAEVEDPGEEIINRAAPAA